MIGKTLNQYRIVGEVGRGGMGEVYLAEDTRLERKVALKVLPSKTAGDPGLRGRFEREAKAIAALSHPNILAIHDFGEAGGVTYAVMELLEGETLRKRLERGATPWRKAVEQGTAIAEGLAAAHSRGIVHRDLKPENLFVTRDGLIKILDFGLASVAQQDSLETADTLTHRTRPGVVLGTAGYMAPEQVRGEATDARTDIFAFGCVMYELLWGAAAFSGATGAERMASILRDAPSQPSGGSSGVPLELERLVFRCLEKDPAERFESVRDLAFTLKNLSASSSPELATRREARAAGRIEALVVLPLRNLSGDPEQDFFADGMTEALITDLAGLGGVRVISRTSAMQYKGVSKRLSEIAAELQVDAVVSGSVLRAGRRVRITAELVQAATDTTLWAQSYERDVDDILGLQSEVARAVAGEIEAKLNPPTETRLAASRQVAPEAYEAYLKGRHYWNRRTEETLRLSVELFNKAIEIDPTYARAHAGLADAYNILGFYSAALPADTFPRAKAAAQRALELDPSLTDVHAVVGYAQLYHDWEWAEAEASIRRTLEANPNASEAHRYYANLLAVRGRLDEALAEIHKATRLDPLSMINRVCTGWVYYFRNEHERAIAEYRKLLEFDRTFALARLDCGWSLLRLSRFDEALHELEQARTYGGAVPLNEAFLAYGHALAGNRPRALEILDGLLARRRESYVPEYLLGLVRLGLGETDAAFEHLERSCELREHWMTMLDVDSRFDGVRDDPRFAALRDRVGLDR